MYFHTNIWKSIISWWNTAKPIITRRIVDSPFATDFVQVSKDSSDLETLWKKSSLSVQNEQLLDNFPNNHTLTHDVWCNIPLVSVAIIIHGIERKLIKTSWSQVRVCNLSFICFSWVRLVTVGWSVEYLIVLGGTKGRPAYFKFSGAYLIKQEDFIIWNK